MHPFVKLAGLSLLVCAALAAWLLWRRAEESTAPEIMLYCAAGMTQPVEEIIAAYQKEYGVRVVTQFGGSGTLLSNLQVAQQGDLFLAGDVSFIAAAREKGLIAETFDIAHLTPVIAVAKGNPKGMRALDDLARADLRVALASPDAASIGKVTRDILAARNLWETVEAAVTSRGVFKPTVNDVANDLKLGTIDAGIVWDATVNLYPELEAVAFDGAADMMQTVTMGVLTFTKKPTDALRFARYMTARDRGTPVFARQGYAVIEGDAWAWTPEVIYYSGGVNRVAIEELVKAFELREGCHITTVYNGCGILLGQLKLGEQPDVYHTCDGSFMRGVEDRFDTPRALSKTDIVIIVPKGNPRQIKTLADLATPGLKLGLAHEEQSTLGWLTAELLNQQGLYDSVRPNVVVNTPTADLLVAQLTAGKLEAAVVYKANTRAVLDRIEVIAIPLPNALAMQTYAISRQTPNRQLMLRFLDVLKSEAGRQRYLNAGFEITDAGGA